MAFYVGQKVVCIGNGNLPIKKDPRTLPIKKGTILTVRDVDCRGLRMGHETATLRFEGYQNPVESTCVGLWEIGYHPQCFRPIVETKTDISIFTKMLTPNKRQRAMT